MRRGGAGTKAPLAWIWGPDPSLGDEEQTLVLCERTAAITARAALRRKTWGGFCDVAGTSLEALLAAWGDEIQEAYGSRPSARDPFSLRDYWGSHYFADVITEPRRAAHDVLIFRPKLRVLLEELGFECGGASPSPASIDCITFRREGQIRVLAGRLRKVSAWASISVRRDFRLVQASSGF